MVSVSADEFFGVSEVGTFTPGTNVSSNDFFGSGEISLAQPQAEEQKLNFLQRFGQDLQRRSDLAIEIEQAVQNGEQSFAEGILQSAGKVGAGAMMDLIGEVLISGGRGLSAVTPDIIEEPLKNAVTSAGHAFLNTDVGQLGLNAAKTGIEKWFEFKENNPRAARNIEAVVNIGLILAPAKAKPAVKAPPTIAGRAAAGLTVKAEKQITESKSKFIQDLVRPKLTAAVRVEEVGRTAEVGILNTKKVKPSPKEIEIATAVEQLPVSSKNTLLGNFNIISEEVFDEADRLIKALEKNDVLIPKREFLSAMDDALARLKENPTIVGDAEKTGLKLIAKMKKIVESKKGTASGLLQARKELDSWMRSVKGPNVFDPKTENALSIALREIRTATNDFIEASTPNVAVKQSLKKQSNLLSAMDNIKLKAADEGSNVILRLWQNALKVVPVRAEFNQLLGIMMGVGGLGIAATFAPFFTKLTFGALGTYATGKLLMSPQTKKTLAGLLKLTDQTIRKVKDEALISQLRLDRAFIVELLKEE